jgi:hypothetical protein
MKNIQKYSIIFSGFIAFILLGYFALQNLPPSQSDEMKNSLSQSGKENNTRKSLETVSQSGNQWGENPFGTGTSSTGDTKKPVFKKPNTEWKTRTLSGITYVFGEGNPKEVALDRRGIQDAYNKCSSGNEQKFSEKGFCSWQGFQYMSPEVEKHLFMALSDPNWIKLAIECNNTFKWADQYQPNPEYYNFDHVFSPGFLNIENFIQIDPITGWKQLGDAAGLSKFLLRATHNGAIEWVNPYGNCVDRYAIEIMRHLDIANDLYFASNDFPN